LFEQLKSIHAVGVYLERVAGESLELGEEPVRYYELACADEETAPQPLRPELAKLGGRISSQPQLLLAPAGYEDEQAHNLVRFIFEDIATIKLQQISEARRLELLAQLDSLHVSERCEIGRFLLTRFEEARKAAPEGSLWHLRRAIASNRSQLAFGVCSQFDEAHQDAFAIWVQLRHHDLQQITGDVESLTTVGVLLTPRHDGRRPWDTTMIGVSGDLELSEEDLSAYREFWSFSRDPELLEVCTAS